MYIGVDIGGTKCAVVKSEDNGNIIEKIRFETKSCQDTIDELIKIIKNMGEAKAIGISCGGPLDSKNGIILSPPNLMGWDDVHIVGIFEKELHIKTYLENDANACALAEWKFGAGKGCDNMVFFTFGTGLGAGLILNGSLYRGASDMAGEAGHIRLSEFGPVGYGKTGSFEGFCSGGGIAQLGKIKAMEKLQMGKTTSYCSDINDIENITAKKLADLAKAGYDDAAEIFKISARKLGMGLSVIIDILNPEKIIIGSIFERCEAIFRDEMEDVLKKECLPISLNSCTVTSAMLGEKIGDLAAISVAINGLEKENAK